MKYTSAEAAKLLRKLNEEHSDIISNESLTKEYVAAVGEDVEGVRPAYDYAETQDKLNELEGRIRIVKHAINAFNVRQEVPGTGMTIDQVLIYIPQLTEKKRKLGAMQACLPKKRDTANSYGRGAAVIDYRYANYDIKAARADYRKVSDELAKIQTALDLVNSTETIEIDL